MPWIKTMVAGKQTFVDIRDDDAGGTIIDTLSMRTSSWLFIRNNLHMSVKVVEEK